MLRVQREDFDVGAELRASTGGLLHAKPFPEDASKQDLSTSRRESGMLVNVHSSLSKADGFGEPIRFGHEARENNVPRDHN